VAAELRRHSSTCGWSRTYRWDGLGSGRPWLAESFVADGGDLELDLAAEPSREWGRRPEDVPPSFSAEPPW